MSRGSRATLPFAGVDGEGGNIPDEDALFGTRHVYQLLRVGGLAIENPRGLSFEECAAFLCSLPKDSLYVGYFFDYDVTMILKSLPAERVQRIMDRDKRTRSGWNLLPVDVGPYQVDYLPHKEFKVRLRGSGQPFTVISDVGTFFQMSFVKALEKWDIGTPEMRADIAAGKLLRSDFTGMTDDIRKYNKLEIFLLEELMTQFRDVCIDIGYVPRQWQGPGYLASAILDAHKVPKRRDIPIMRNDQFRALANEAYYGGRFETTAAGPISGPVYQYDINSAYPSVLRTLPCLHHGSWKQVHRMPDTGVWFGEVVFDHPAGRLLYNLPVRNRQGNISFPRAGSGVYWSSELVAAMAAQADIGFLKGWEYEQDCDCVTFDFVDGLYEERLRLGKTNRGYVLKLGMNSKYGKIAQSIGFAPYANPVWAGMITAGTRAMLIDAYRGREDDVFMLATDGLFTGKSLDVKISPALGDWELTTHDDGMFIVQPGIYFLPGGEVKTRGVERGRIHGHREEFEQAWERYATTGQPTAVEVEVVNFITAKQALARNNWKIAGSWEKTARHIAYDWSTKREPGIGFHDGRALRTLPLSGIGGRSVPYPKMIGGELRPSLMVEQYKDPGLLESERMAEQPDWVNPLIEG